MSQWLVDQTPRTAARNGVRNNAFWFIIPTFTAPFALLHQGIAQVACYDSSVVCIVHILITFDKDQFQSKTYRQQSFLKAIECWCAENLPQVSACIHCIEFGLFQIHGEQQDPHSL
jgi:hypothetical protein